MQNVYFKTIMCTCSDTGCGTLLLQQMNHSTGPECAYFLKVKQQNLLDICLLICKSSIRRYCNTSTITPWWMVLLWKMLSQKKFSYGQLCMCGSEVSMHTPHTCWKHTWEEVDVRVSLIYTFSKFPPAPKRTQNILRIFFCTHVWVLMNVDMQS